MTSWRRWIFIAGFHPLRMAADAPAFSSFTPYDIPTFSSFALYAMISARFLLIVVSVSVPSPDARGWLRRWQQPVPVRPWPQQACFWHRRKVCPFLCTLSMSSSCIHPHQTYCLQERERGVRHKLSFRIVFTWRYLDSRVNWNCSQ